LSDMPKTLQDVLDGLIRERGGLVAFDTKAMVTARALTRVLAAVSAGDTSKAASIPALEAMLPPKTAQPGRPWDLSKLNNKQLALLDKLACIATGEAVPKSEHRPRSRRYWLAQDLARVLDNGVTGEIGMAEASPETLIEVRGLVTDLLSPLHIPVLFEETFRGAWAYPPTVENNAPAASPESARAVPAAGNVVPIRPDYSYAKT
jgi:hypothetical protein